MVSKQTPVEQTRALLYILITAIAGGSISTFSKISLQEIPVLSFAFLRFLLASLTILPVFLIQKMPLSKEKIPGVIVVSLLATLNTLLFVFGVKKTTAGIAQTLYAAVPLITGMLSYFLLKEKLVTKKLLGIVIGFVGVIIIVLGPLLSAGSGLAGDLRGNIIIVIAAFSFALYSVLAKKFQINFTPLQLTTIFIVVTCIVQLFLVPFDLHNHPGWWQNVSVKAWLGLIYVGIIGTSAYYLTFQYAIKHASPTTASTILYLQPVFSLVWAFFLLGEILTSEFIIGAIMAFIGVALVTNQKNNGDDQALNQSAI